jgi:predicted DNA-binding protein (MmcQ/YjbR family)
MDYEQLHRYLSDKPGVQLDFPFDQATLVFKVAGKMFALIMLDAKPLRMNFKCDSFKA